jgi:plasmid stability protein
MSKMIRIRNVPDGLHSRLEARAALEGRSLSDYLLEELRRMAERPTLEELRQRIAGRAPAVLHVPVAEAVRAERDAREQGGGIRRRATPPSSS